MMPIHIMAKVILVPCSVNETVERDNFASHVEVPINNATTVPIQCDYVMTDRCTIVVPRLFEEKRKDIVLAFRHSVRPSVRPSRSVCPSVFPSPYRVCTLCAQLLLQFYSDSFVTLQVFLPSF